MKNYLQLELGGKLRGLKFNIGTLNFIQEITGIDPFEYRTETATYKETLPYATNILHAALLSNCLSKKEDPDFTVEDIKEWVNDLDVPTLTDVVIRYSAIMVSPKPHANGEVGTDTQQANV